MVRQGIAAEARARTEAFFESVAQKKKWYTVLRDFLRRTMARLRGDKMQYQPLKTEQMLVKAWQAVKESQGAQEAVKAVQENGMREAVQTGDEKFSIEFDPNSGKHYVAVEIDDITGEGIDENDDIGNKARKFLKEKFNKTVLPLGKTESAYINLGAIKKDDKSGENAWI